MPYAHIRQKIPRELDRRVKITEEQKQGVKEAYKNGIPQRAIARETGISRRMIHFILFPERLVVYRLKYSERRKDGRYYDKEKHKEAMKKHRQYKQSIKSKLI